MPTRSAIFAWLSPSKYARRRSRRSRVQDVEAVPEQDAVIAELVALLERTVVVELAVLAVHDLRDAGPQRRVVLQQPPRNPHRPGAVPKVPLDLTVDRRDRVGGEVDAAIELEPVDRLDQADRAHLDEILELLTVPDVPAR